MVLTEAVPVRPQFARFPPSFLPPFQGSTLFDKQECLPPYWERATSSSVLTVNNGRKSRRNDRRATRYRICP